MVQQKAKKIKGVADIVFCIDATGSMQGCIDNIKLNIKDFANSITDSYPNAEINWQARILPYRDLFEDENSVMNHLDFVSTSEKIEEQLSGFIAEMGDDEPESTLDAILYAAENSKWRKGTNKFIVVITDATPKNLHPNTLKEFGLPDSDINKINQILMEKRIILFIYAQKHPEYEKLRAYKTQLFENAAEEFNKSMDYNELMKYLGKTVTGLSSGKVY